MLYNVIASVEEVLIRANVKPTVKSIKLLSSIIDHLKGSSSTLTIEELKKVLSTDGGHLLDNLRKHFNPNLGKFVKLDKYYIFTLTNDVLKLIENLSLTSENVLPECTPDDQSSKTLTKESNNKGVTLTSKEKPTLTKPIKIENIPCEYDRNDIHYAEKRAGSLSAAIDAKLKGGYSPETMEAIKHIHDKDDDWIEY